MRFRTALMVAALVLTSSSLTHQDQATSSLRLIAVRENRQKNSAGTLSSHTVETGFYRLRFSGSPAHVVGLLTIDSATFERDGRARVVVPEGSSQATISFERQGFRYRIDSLPAAAKQYPFIATVGLELPQLFLMIPRASCALGRSWHDSSSVSVHPAPVGDSITLLARSSFRVTSATNLEVIVESSATVVGEGYQAARSVMWQHETRRGVWHLSATCGAPGRMTETREGYIAFANPGGAAPDTLHKAEQRRLSFTPTLDTR